MMTDIWTLTWVAGPDTGGRVVLGCGTHIVGRAAGAAVRCDDGALELHHLLIEISPAGVTLRQLTGRLPVRVDGEAVAESVVIVDTAQIELGHSLLMLERGDLTAPAQVANRANIVASANGAAVLRRPRAASQWNPDALSPPAELRARREATGGVLPAVLALAGAGLVAVLLHQPMFLLFGALGAIVAFGTWGGQRISLVHRRRRDERSRRDEAAQFASAVAAQRAGFVAHHLANVSTPVSARSAIEARTGDLWARRGTHPDAFVVSIGLGSIPWAPRLDDSAGANRATGRIDTVSMLSDLPLVADVGAACRLAVRGDPDRAGAVVRSIVMQLAANCGPADVRLVIVTQEPSRWRWLEGLPHATSAAGLVAVVAECELQEAVAESDVAPHPHLVVITDAPELLAARTSPVRRVVMADRSTALIVLVGGDAGIPHVCSSLLDLSGPMSARWHADAAVTSLPVHVRVSAMGERTTRRLVGCLSGLVDPEDPLSDAGGVPHRVTLMALLSSHQPAAIAASWVAGGVDPVPRTVIGVAADGVVDIDLERDGPHALIAGTTGAGKSELLRTLVAGLAVASSPDHLTFVLIDYKGGSTFDACAELPHVVGVVTDLDEHLANRALRCLHAELRRREQLLRDVGAADLPAYRHVASANEMLPRLVVVIDEFAALVTEQPKFLHALVGIAQRGRSLGVHLILATQRPSGVISDDIRANTNLRLALRLHDTADALDVVGDRAPAGIPRGLAGRAVMRLGPEEVLTFQTAQSTAPLASGGTELAELVVAVRDAAALVGSRTPKSPWPAPLPAELPVDGSAVTRGVVGLADDPDAQCVVPLHWDRSDGHLLLVGAAGSGVTSTLCLLGTAAAMDGSGCHLYVIDGRGDPALMMFERSPWCGGLVRVHERERLMRLLNRLGDEVGQRIAHPATPRNPVLVLVDGLDVIRGSLDDVAAAAELDKLDTIIALGAAHGVVIVCGFDRVGAIPSSVLAHCAQRWVFHLTDPHDAVGLGVAASDVPRPQPGRIVVASSGLEAQLMIGSLPLPSCVAGTGPPPVVCVPAQLDSLDLPPGVGHGDGSFLPLGVRFGDGRVCHVDVPDGEHLLIVGPPRSGRSTALQRMIRAWRDAYPAGWWSVVAPRRTVIDAEHRHRSLATIIDDIPDDGRVLIAVEDAELVDDPSGKLTRLAASRRHGLMIIATGKPDALRQSYGHWTGIVRRSRLGIVASASNDLDGDLVGAVLPRRTPVPPRPGLMWLVSDGEAVLTQVAIDQADRTDPAVVA